MSHRLLRRLALAALLAPGLVAAGTAPVAAAPPAGVRVVTLLADNTLVVSPLGGSGQIALQLGRYRRGKVPPPRALATGQLHGRTVVYVLVNGQGDSRIVAVDVGSGAVVAARYRLPPARRYAALVRVGGALYAFGNDAKRRAVVVRVAIAGGRTRTLFKGRTAFVYDGAVDVRGRFAVVSYHGARSSGADVVALVPRAPACRKGRTRREACLEVHGAVYVRGGRVVATFGANGVRIARLDGGIVRTIPVRLARDHFMAMAITESGIAILPGSCGDGGGIATVDLATGAVRIVAPPPPRQADRTFGSAAGCGDGVALGPDELVAITQPSRPVPQPDGSGHVVVWQDWNVVARLAVSPDPVDVALVRVEAPAP